MTGRYKDYLKRLDTNGDGVVDSDELEGLGGTGSPSRSAPKKPESEKKDD